MTATCQNLYEKLSIKDTIIDQNIQDATGMKTELDNEIQLLKQKLMEAQTIIEQQTDYIQQSSSKIVCLFEGKSALQTEVNLLNESIAKYATNEESLNTKITELTNARNKFSVDLGQLNENNQSKEAEISKLTKTYQEVLCALNSIQIDKDQLSAECRIMTEQQANSNVRIDVLKDIEKKYGTLQIEYKELQNDRQKLECKYSKQITALHGQAEEQRDRQNEMRCELDHLLASNVILARERDALQTEIDRSVAECASNEDSFNTKIIEITNARNKLAVDLCELNESLQLKDAEIFELNQQKNEVFCAVQSIQLEKDQLFAKIQTMTQNQTESNARIDVLKDFEQKYGALKSEYNELQNDRQKLECTYSKQIAALHGQAEEQRDRRNEIRRELDQSIASNNIIVRERDELLAKLQQLEMEHKLQIEKLYALIDSLRSKTDSLQNTVSNKDTEIVKLTDEIESLKQQIARLTSVEAVLRKDIAQYEVDALLIKRLEVERDSFEVELSKANMKAENMHKQLSEQQQHIQEQKNDIQARIEQIAVLKDHLRNGQEVNAKVQSAANEERVKLTGDISQLNKDLTATQQNLYYKQETIDTLSKELELRRGDYAEVQREKSELEQQMAQANIQNKNLQRDNEEYWEKLVEQQKVHEEISSELNGVKNELTAAHRVYAELTEQSKAKEERWQEERQKYRATIDVRNESLDKIEQQLDEKRKSVLELNFKLVSKSRV